VLSSNSPSLGTLSSTAWTVNQPNYSGSVPITGGTAPYSNLSATGLPPGLTAALSGSTITLSGTPTTAGTYSNVTLGVQDASGNTTSRTFSIAINAPPALGTLSPTQWTAGVSAYAGAIPISGGTGPLTVVAQANLPPGLSATVSGSSVVFTGIPTTTGTYSNVQLTVGDAAGATTSGTFSITINAPQPGSILTIAGTGTAGYSGDGGAVDLARLNEPWSTAVDGSGNVFIADYFNNCVREIVKATGNIITVAGTGVAGYSGDGGPATSAKLYMPTFVTLDASGDLFIADLYNQRIREVVKATGNIITVAGNGSNTDSGDGGPATSAGLASPQGVAVDSSGNIFIADYYTNRIREVVKATGNIITVAGNGALGYSGDGGPATSAMLYDPTGVAVDASGNLFIADSGNERVREVVQATGNIITIAGTGSAGYSGDAGPATSAKMWSPENVAVDGNGNVFIADAYNYRIREVSQLTGAIYTVAGTGTAGYSGDGGPATSAAVNHAYGVAVDGSGDLFIADTYNDAVREVLPIPAPVLGPLSLSQWTVNQGGYSDDISITGAAPPSGSFLTTTGLPPGLTATLNNNFINISGTPTAVGTYSATLTIRGMSGAPLAARTYTFTINAPPALGTLGWPTQWTVGQSGYAGTIPTSGGTGPLNVVVQSNLPPGLSAMTVGSGIIFTGTPTVTGTFSNIQLTVLDTVGATATGTYSITINPVPTLGPLSTTAWTANQPGIGTVSVLGGTMPLVNLTATGLPSGLHASLADDNNTYISGTPTTAGTYNNIQLSVQDYAGATASGTYSLTVTAPAATLSVTNYPTDMTAGSSGSFTVTALDSSGQVATGYRGTVFFGSSDGAATLPDPYTFTAADNGGHSFDFTLRTAGREWLYAKDPGGINNDPGQEIDVTPSAADHIQITAPTSADSFYGFNVTATVLDAYNNPVTGYTGTVHFTSSDAAAVLPADYTFTAGDQGSHTFQATLETAGSQTITATDASNSAVSGMATVQDVNAIPGLHYLISAPSTTTAGSPFTVTVTALDQNNQLASHYLGAMNLSFAGQWTGPGSYTFTSADAGVHTFSNVYTLFTAGSGSIAVADSNDQTGATATSAGITVKPAAASTLSLSGFPTTDTANSTQSFTVAARDPYGNVATGYSGTIHFTSSDPAAILPADTTLTNGIGTFTADLRTPGSQSLMATDTVDSSLTATEGGITVNPAPVARFAVTGFPSPTTAGAAGTFTVTALDASGSSVLGYNGTVHFTSSDGQAVLPADAALTNGTGTFSATFKTAGIQSLTVADAGNSSLIGSQTGIAVSPAAAASLSLAGFPSPYTAGVAGTVTVTAHDAFGNVATGYTGTVHFTSSDAQAVLPADYTFTAADGGTHTFSVTLDTAGTQILTVADTTGSPTNASQGGIVVNAAAATHLSGSGPASNIPNSGYPITVWAADAYGNRVFNYTGTVHFTSSDPQAVLPADYTFTSADQGIHNFVATFKTVGNQTLTVTDTGTTGVSGVPFNVSVQVGAASGLNLSDFPSSTVAGASGSFTVRAYDLYGNTATGYTGTVHFTSSDAAAVLPADYTFTAADAGVHTFSAVLKTAGGQGIWVQDVAGGFTSAQYAIQVTPAAASQFVVTGYSSAITAGGVDNVTIAVRDAYGNLATGYTGTVHISSSDAQAALPADYTFTAADGGVHTFAVTLKTAGTQSITFQDAPNDLTVTQGGIAVSPAAANSLVMSALPSSTTAGNVLSFTLTALDAYGNVATGYTGTVHVTSSDGQALLPSDYTFTGSDNGSHLFLVSLRTAGVQAVTVTDTATPSLAATQSGINVTAAAMSGFLVSGYPATTAGVAHSFTVTAVDAYGNLVSGYRGTVHFTSSDGKASLPGNYTFTASDNGVHTFSATLKTAGTQSLIVTDTGTSTITGSETGITVTGATATHLSISMPANVSSGGTFSVTVTALDAYGNVATGYTGTVHFTSTDSTAILPANYTFTAADAGVHTFIVTFKKKGTQTLTATDTHTGSIKGSASTKVS
jgi:hypothetical protein